MFGRDRHEILPPRIVLNAVEGWGKTTCGAFADSPAFLMANGETGYETLLAFGLVPDVDRAMTETWLDTLATLDAMIVKKIEVYSTLVLDAMNGFERQCQEYVCQEHFDGDWGERGFAGYAKGYELTVGEWIKLLARLDQIRARCKTTILVLSHCKIKPFKNPEGPDYDRYASNCHDKVWDATKQWADAVLFGNFLTGTLGNDPKKKTKAVGDDTRIVQSVRSAAYDAKNRFGISKHIEIPDDPSKAWSTIWKAITERKETQ